LKNRLKDYLTSPKSQTTIILLITPVLISLYRYLGKPEIFYYNLAPGFSSGSLYGFYGDFFDFLMAFLFLMLIPVALLKIFFKARLKDYGFILSEVRTGLKVLMISLPLVIITTWVSSCQPDFQKEYSAFRLNPLNIKSFLIYAAAFFIYYLAFEFFFRGFLLLGLEQSFGSINSLLIQTIPCCLIHLGKPFIEVLASIPASLIFGYVVLKTRSLWSVIIIHWLIGLLLVLFIGLK